MLEAAQQHLALALGRPLLVAISFSRSRIAAITVVFPVPGGPWITAMSGVLSATSIARSCMAVGGFLKTFSRTNAVRGLILWGGRKEVISPFSSTRRPSCGFAARPSRIDFLAWRRRLI